MSDVERSHTQLLEEMVILRQQNAALRQRNTELETLETKLTHTQEALQQERNLLSLMMDTSPVGIAVVNAEGQITFANERAEQVLGTRVSL